MTCTHLLSGVARAFPGGRFAPRGLNEEKLRKNQQCRRLRKICDPAELRVSESGFGPVGLWHGIQINEP